MLSINEYTHITLLNKVTNLYSTNKSHTRKYKKKYNDCMDNNKVGHIKLDYEVVYNWNNELKRIKNFS